MASTPVGEYYHSGTPMNLTVTGRTTSTSPRASASVELSDEMSHSSFLRWKQEMQNRYIVQSEKRQMKERKNFKEQQDEEIQRRKADLHRKTSEEEVRAREKATEWARHNSELGEMYKQDLAVMRDLRRRQHEEWAQFGHELTLEFSEHVERRRESLARATEEKAEIGRRVREEEEYLKNRLQAQRAQFLEEARQHVLSLKEEEIGKTDEAMRFALRQRQSKVEKVKRTERAWSADTKGQREAFLGHARENREKAETTRHMMRGARRDLVQRNNKTARAERQRKEDDAAELAERKAAVAAAKQSAHDSVYTNRKVSPEKVRMMKEIGRAKSPEKAAARGGHHRRAASLAAIALQVGRPVAPPMTPDGRVLVRAA